MLKTNNIRFIEKCLQAATNKKQEITICLLMSLLSENESDNIELLQTDEISYIHNSLRKFGFFTEYFYNEITFINFMELTTPENRLIYNLLRQGHSELKKGLIPYFCNNNNIDCMGSSFYTIALCKNKYHSFKLLETQKIPVAHSWLFDEFGWIEPPPIGTLILLKPIYESLSKGIHESNIFVYTGDNKNIVQLNNIWKQPILAQQFISGYEVEVPLLINNNDNYVILPPVGISIDGNQRVKDSIISQHISKTENYGYYTANDIPFSVEKLKEITYKIIRVIHFSDYARLDFRVDDDGNMYLIDISTTPYLTKESSFAHSFKQLGLEPELMHACVIGAHYWE